MQTHTHTHTNTKSSNKVTVQHSIYLYEIRIYLREKESVEM